MGKWQDRLKDHLDAVNLAKAEGLLGYLKSQGFTVSRLKSGDGIAIAPANNIDDDIRRMVREARPHLYTLLVIEEAARR
jgi:hypothetical protein